MELNGVRYVADGMSPAVGGVYGGLTLIGARGKPVKQTRLLKVLDNGGVILGGFMRI